MKRGRGLVLFTVLVTFGFLSALGADVPERREEFIYSIVAFQGDEYTGTFSREDSEKIYFLADRDNFLIGQNTFVYFWPITEEWRHGCADLSAHARGNTGDIREEHRDNNS